MNVHVFVPCMFTSTEVLSQNYPPQQHVSCQSGSSYISTGKCELEGKDTIKLKVEGETIIIANMARQARAGKSFPAQLKAII